VSEIVAGLVLDGRVSAESVDPSILDSPYDVAVRMVAEGAAETDLLDSVGIHALDIAHKASAASKGDVYKYIEACEKAAVRVRAASQLRPIVDKLERGEDVDVARALSALAIMQNGHRTFTPADQVEPEPLIYLPSGYPPLDNFIGGYPRGLTIVAGITGTGKTSFLIELAIRCAAAGKTCAVLTLEMTNGEIMYRMFEIDPRLTKKTRKLILLSDDVYDVDEVYAVSSQLAAQHKLHFLGVDYADMLVGSKEQSEGVMGRVYNTLAVLAKKLRIPVILVAQYRRIDGRVPSIEDIRYSGRAEQAAAMILLLYNPGKVWSRSFMVEDNNPLTIIEGTAHIVLGKTRFKGPKQRSTIGAIRVFWKENGGRWGDAVGRDAWQDLSGRI
jgi:replicative DNA helicase